MDIHNTMHKPHRHSLRIILFVASLLFSFNIHASLVLTIDKTTYTIKPKQKQAVKPDTDRLLLEIGNGYFRYIENDHEFNYDFIQKRIISKDLKAKTYQDDSLYMDLGFRGYEFQNRLHLGRALSAVDVKDNPMAITINEHGLSLKAKDHPSGITKKNGDSFISFTWEGKELFNYSKKHTPVKSNYAHDFVRFIRYHLGGHPDILNALQSSNGIPSTLTMKRYNVATTTTTLKLVSHQTRPDTKLDLSNYKKLNMDGELTNLVSDETEFNKSALRKSSNALLSNANNSFNKKHYLDTMLTYLEYTLVTGEQMPSAFSKQRDAIVNDQNVKTLLKSFSPKNKEEANKFVSTLVGLRKNTKKHNTF